MTEHVPHIPTAADAETQLFEDEVSPVALNLSATMLWCAALFALAILPWATLPGKRDLGWFQEPWSWPFVVLTLSLVGGGIQPIRLLKLSSEPGFRSSVMSTFAGMGRALVYTLSFLLYLGAVHLIGFTIASIIYMQALYYMSGLRGGKWPFVALAVSVAIIIVFRIGLHIWFPMPSLFHALPDWIGNSFGDYL